MSDNRPDFRFLVLPILILSLVVLGITGIFVALKLLGSLTLSWWWVFSPVWLPGAIGWGAFLVIIIIAFANGLYGGIRTGVAVMKMQKKSKSNGKYDA